MYSYSGLAVPIEEIKAEAVGQSCVPGKQGLVDFDGRLRAAGNGRDPGAAAVDQSKRLRVLDADAKGPVDIALAPRRVAEMSLAV